MPQVTPEVKKLANISPGTLLIIDREIATDKSFKSYLKEMLMDEDPAKRVYIEMKKAQLNVMNPQAFKSDMGVHRWKWMRRRIKPITANHGVSGIDGMGQWEAIASMLVSQAGKELSKEKNQKSIMSFMTKKTGSRTELRARRNQVADQARKMGIPEDQITKAKTEPVAEGKMTFEEAFGLTPKVSQAGSSVVQGAISEAQIRYEEEQAGKLSEGAARQLGVDAQRKAGKGRKTNTYLLIGGGIALALALGIGTVLTLR